jgi:lipopolysaccharide/colanic/teichoic acid biosynthesis glycosyltransferase
VKRPSAQYLTLKRTLDVAVSATALLVLAPLLAGLSVAVKLSSPGPALFRQTRVGRDGRPFRIVKFRSMRNSVPGPSVTSAGDGRVTRVGAIMRRYKLDELPQLWNVLVGDMSLVGPRPEVDRYVQLFPEAYAHILKVRPGLTDYAALEYRHEEATLGASPDPETAYAETVLPAKIALYHRYLDEMSLGTDVTLVLRTLAALLR